MSRRRCCCQRNCCNTGWFGSNNGSNLAIAALVLLGLSSRRSFWW